MEKVLVTGATGFLGSYVIHELLRRGYEVVATSAHKAKAEAAKWFDRVHYIEFDLLEFNNAMDYVAYFGKPDLLVHLAWEGLPNYSGEFHTRENLPRHLAFLKNLISNGLTDLTVSGTCLEYGMQEGCLSEAMECHPSNPYGIAKNELRKGIEAFISGKKISMKWARLFYMYGKGQNPNSLISQLDRALENNEPVFNMSGGEQVRDFLPVQQVSEYLVDIATQQRITGIINCCSGNPVKVKDFVEHYIEGKNETIMLNLGYYPYTDYEPMAFWGNNQKLQSIINSTNKK